MYGYAPNQVKETDMISRNQLTDVDDGCTCVFFRVLESRDTEAKFSQFSTKDHAKLSALMHRTKDSSGSIGALTKEEWDDTVTWAFKQLT